jgi:hypothetical protein
VVSSFRMEAKQIAREAIRLAYSPSAPKSGQNRLAYSVSWIFDAVVVLLLVAFATLYFAA